MNRADRLGNVLLPLRRTGFLKVIRPLLHTTPCLHPLLHVVPLTLPQSISRSTPLAYSLAVSSYNLHPRMRRVTIVQEVHSFMGWQLGRVTATTLCATEKLVVAETDWQQAK